MARKRTTAPSVPEIDLNQVVSYNVRRARELRGWSQQDFSARLEPFVGQRMSQAAISSIERAYEGDRRREFDAQELLVFAMVFDLPMIWFLLPPPEAAQRLMRGTNRPLGELYAWLFGRPEQLGPLYDRLRELGARDPTAAEEAVERITGQPSGARQWSYKERRKEVLLALLDQHADDLDAAADELGRLFDRLRQVGIRGFLAEHTKDDNFTRESDEAASAEPADQPAQGGRVRAKRGR